MSSRQFQAYQEHKNLLSINKVTVVFVIVCVPISKSDVHVEPGTVLKLKLKLGLGVLCSVILSI